MEKEHLEILLEDIRGKFDLVLEGHDALRKEIRDTREELCEKISLVDFKVGVLNEKIDDVQENLTRKIEAGDAGLHQRIDAVETSLSQRIDARDASLHKRIDAVETSLGQRIDAVETSLGQKIDAVATDLAAHRRDTEAHPSVYKVKEDI